MNTCICQGRRGFPALAMLLTLTVISILALATPSFAVTYDPLNVISYDTWRGSSSMSAADIQAFLETKPGPLKSLVAKDHAGVKKSAAVIIWEAARYWNLNPKVILATLDKEQSLIGAAPHVKTVTHPHGTYDYHIPKAMGCGVYAGSKNTYPGFGNQVWNGARKLSTYEVAGSEPGQLAGGWKPGTQIRVYSYPAKKKITIVPKNASTWSLYVYTPYYPQKSFWDIYVRYFGDPQQPARMRPVYRFVHRDNGSLRYRSSETERYKLIKRWSTTYRYNGIAFTVDSSATANSKPLYRLYNPATQRWRYTPYTKTRARLLATGDWRPRGAAALISLGATGTPVFKLENRRTHAMYFTTSTAKKQDMCYGRAATHYYRGVAFRLEKSVPATTPVGSP